MRGTLLTTTASAALVLAAALPGAAVASSLTAFQTPSKQIACVYARGGGEPSQLRCDVARPVAPPKRPASCELDWGHAFGLTLKGKAERLCTGDTVLNPKAPVLAYGKTKRYGPFTCTARTSGLRCVTRGGHGFALSRATQKLF